MSEYNDYRDELVQSVSESVEDTRLQILDTIKLGAKVLEAGEHAEHGPITSMGVPKNTLPRWDDIQILTAQLGKKPLLDNSKVDTGFVLGPRAKNPLKFDIPLFVSDMSYGALSKNAKEALARGADLVGSGICSGEGGILSNEIENCERYLFEMGTARNGIKPDNAQKDKEKGKEGAENESEEGSESDFFERYNGRVKAFHFKGGQAAKTGTGGHLPGSKVSKEIAKTRGIEEGEDSISPATFTDFKTIDDFQQFANKVREKLGGIPIGFKLSANHIEQDIQYALYIGVDYIILDGRGGSTGAAPSIFRDHISVPTIPALARARAYLDKAGHKKGSPDSVSLIITGGLRVPSDFIKALALGADAIALSNSALQAIGCIGARICNSGNCPAGIATQSEHLVNKLNVAEKSVNLAKFFTGATHLMQVMARACGYNSLSQFQPNDLSTFNSEMAKLTGINYAGIDK